MGQTHYTRRDLSWGSESIVRWATEPVGRAVVFVHGFGGEALGTWDQFATLLPLQPQAAGRDLFFYGYDSLVAQAPVSAAELLDFLQALWTDPVTRVIQPTLQDARRADPGFRYMHVSLVAHSLGAVVVREALVQAAMDTPPAPWLKDVSLVLFAPAHTGAVILDLANEALGAMPAKFGAAAATGAKAFVPVLRDLEPGSDMLDKLRDDTDDLLGQGHDSLRAKVVVLGKKDRIVQAVRFCKDPGPRIVPDKGHIGVCKPDTGYLDPLGYLLPHI